jgi:cation transport ATPase
LYDYDHAGPGFGAAAMTLSSISVIGNALRLRFGPTLKDV